jgi:hypothetical protein
LCRFLAGSSDSDSDGEGKRVVKSEKDKRMLELRQAGEDIRVRLQLACTTRPEAAAHKAAAKPHFSPALTNVLLF